MNTKNTFKRILSSVLAIFMLICALPAKALQTESKPPRYTVTFIEIAELYSVFSRGDGTVQARSGYGEDIIVLNGRTGKTQGVLPSDEEDMACTDTGLVGIADDGGRMGLFSTRNEMMLPCEYDTIIYVDSGLITDYYWVRKNGFWGIAAVRDNIGDVNGDGEIDETDALEVLWHDARLKTLADGILHMCDINGDGVVNAIDASLILQFCAELIPRLADDKVMEYTPSNPTLPFTGEYIRTGRPTNYALRGKYKVLKGGVDDDPSMFYGVTTEVKTDDFRDDDCKKLNDGIVAKGEEMDEHGMTPGVNVQYIGTGATFHCVFTLDEHYGDIKTVVFRNMRDANTNSGRGWDDKIFVYTSDDGVNWGDALAYRGPVKTKVPGAPEISNKRNPEIKNVENVDISYTLEEAAKGRYVKIIFGGGGGTAYIVQLDEIEIWN